MRKLAAWDTMAIPNIQDYSKLIPALNQSPQHAV